VLEQAATSGVVEVPRRGGAAEALAVLFQEGEAEAAQPGVLHAVDALFHPGVFASEKFAALRRSGEEFFLGVRIKRRKIELVDVQAVAVAVEAARSGDAITRLQGLALGEGRAVLPDLEFCLLYTSDAADE